MNIVPTPLFPVETSRRNAKRWRRPPPPKGKERRCTTTKIIRPWSDSSLGAFGVTPSVTSAWRPWGSGHSCSCGFFSFAFAEVGIAPRHGRSSARPQHCRRRCRPSSLPMTGGHQPTRKFSPLPPDTGPRFDTSAAAFLALSLERESQHRLSYWASNAFWRFWIVPSLSKLRIASARRRSAAAARLVPKKPVLTT